MKRRTYQPSELRAGQTIFVGRIDFRSWPPRPLVAAHLVTSRRGHMPSEGEMYPYRLRPELVAHIGQFSPLFRKRRDAQRWVELLTREIKAQAAVRAARVEKRDAAVTPAEERPNQEKPNVPK